MASGHNEWFADESIWKDLYPFPFPESAFAVAEEQVEKILRLTGVRGGSVLDLCCGPGRHAVALAKRGFAVTAVDRSRFLVEQARARVAQDNVSVEFVLEDMRRFSCPATFDLIINFFTSFGYFEDRADDLRVRELIRENLRPSGVFVLEMVSKERLAREFQATTSRQLPNGDVLFERHEIVDDWTRVRNRWTLIRGGGLRTFEFTHRIYSGREMKDFLTRAGLVECVCMEISTEVHTASRRNVSSPSPDDRRYPDRLASFEPLEENRGQKAEHRRDSGDGAALAVRLGEH